MHINCETVQVINVAKFHVKAAKLTTSLNSVPGEEPVPVVPGLRVPGADLAHDEIQVDPLITQERVGFHDVRTLEAIV